MRVRAVMAGEPRATAGSGASGRRRWRGAPVAEVRALGRVLVIDDNPRYMALLTAALAPLSQSIEHADSAAQGIARLTEGAFDAVVTDLSMETELAGLRVLAYLRRQGFGGQVAVASTAMDRAIGLAFNRIYMGWRFGCHYVVPKRPLRERGELVWVRTVARHASGLSLGAGARTVVEPDDVHPQAERQCADIDQPDPAAGRQDDDRK